MRRGRRNFCAASAICRLLGFHIGRARYPCFLSSIFFFALMFCVGVSFTIVRWLFSQKDDNGEAPVSVDGREKSVG